MGDNTPPLCLLVQSNEAVPESCIQQRFASNIYTFSPSGTLLAVSLPGGVDVWSLYPPKKVSSLTCISAAWLAFSPGSNFLVTCQKPNKENKDARNLQVWDILTGSAVLDLVQKSVTKESWPVVQWAGDDSAAYVAVTNTVHAYRREDNFQAFKKINIPGVTRFAASPGPQQCLAAYVKGSKGSPDAAMVVDVAGGQPIVRRSFFRTQGAQLMWNKTGSAVLVMCYSDTDAQNQSYYGEQQLHYMPADAGRADAACKVEPIKEGPVHDVQWSPDGAFFVVVHGYMPAHVTLFNDKAKAVYQLGSGPYNMVRWSPLGRFFLIAGFGNLPGDIVVFDKKSSGTCKQMAALRCPSVTCDWAPDGRRFVTAIIAPRLRVDNGYKLFTYYGEPVGHQDFDLLLEAAWAPAPPGAWPDRPATPERLPREEAGASPVAAKVAAAQAAAYVPPALRGQPAAAQRPASATFSLAYDATSQVGKVKATKNLPPGAEPASAGLSKSSKKRANKKGKSKGGEAGDDGDEGGEEGTQGEPQEAPSTSEPVMEAAAAHAVAQMSVQDDDEGDAGKRIRALQKKLRQIQQLKERLAKEGEVALGPEAVAKVKSEEALRAELAQLGGTFQ